MRQDPKEESPWAIAARQHGVIARHQLIELGLSRRAIQHRVARGRLHPVMRGVYAVGRAEVGQRGRWMAAVLSCGEGVVLSHRSAASLWGIAEEWDGLIELSSQGRSELRRPGLRVRRRRGLPPEDVGRRDGIPTTTALRTLIDLATVLGPSALERAVNEADRVDLIDPESLRSALERYRGCRGVAGLEKVLDRRAFRLTDSELERRFLRIAVDAGMPVPQTQVWLNGHRVDFHWPEIGLVVETDGLRYHRTPAQQARDRVRDNAHAEAGLCSLRFTHAQVRFEPAYVIETLRSTARRLGRCDPSAHPPNDHARGGARGPLSP